MRLLIIRVHVATYAMRCHMQISWSRAWAIRLNLWYAARQASDPEWLRSRDIAFIIKACGLECPFTRYDGIQQFDLPANMWWHSSRTQSGMRVSAWLPSLHIIAEHLAAGRNGTFRVHHSISIAPR